MKKSDLILWIPTVFGILLLLVSFVDLQQFKAGTIDPRAMLNREVPLVLLGFLSATIMLIFSVIFLFKKKWYKVAQSITSIILFFVCFIIGGIMGAAYLNAT